MDLFRVSSVVTCKPFLANPGGGFNQDAAYMYVFRLLLERLSWLTRQSGGELHYVLGHVVRFKMEKLREYEAILRGMPKDECQIAWEHVTAKGGRIDQPQREEFLQLADIAASAHGAAFNLDQFGHTELRYVQNLRPVMYCPDNKPLTTYGLKMHPWRDDTKAAYPWVAAL